MKGNAVLESLLGEEESLIEIAKTLKSDLERLNGKMVLRQNQVDFLVAKVAELKLGKSNCPFPNEDINGESHQERMKLTPEQDSESERLAETLLNEDMWREVFSNVDDGQDLLNASRSCQHFHDILDPLKNNFLFEKVLLFLFLHLNLNDVLKCCLVCRDWRVGIRSFIEGWAKNDMLHFPPYIDSNPFSNISFKLMHAYRFEISPSADSIDANQFLQVFNSPVRNPFVAHSIAFTLDHNYKKYSELLQYRKEISTILETFGRHIRHANCFVVRSSNLVTVDLLRELFGKAKNLQTLVVSGFEDHVAKLQFEDITYSLPNLKTLAFKIDGKSPTTNWLFRNLHLQITTLQLENYEGLIAVAEFTWPAVTDLKIDSLDMHEENDYLKCFGSFPGLTKLCIRVLHSTLPKILRIIHHLPKICPSFHALQLHLCLYEADSLCRKGITVNAPKELDTLELNVFNCGDCLHPWRAFAFLLCFPFIKMLSIVCDPQGLRHLNSERWRNSCKLEIVEIYKYLQTISNPRSSNIWRMIPNLETLQIQNKIYKRPATLHQKRE